MSAPNEPPATQISASAQRIVLLYSVLVGLCPLIPVPFLDEFAKGLLTRRMARALLAEHGLTTSNTQIQRLTRERAGCGLGCLSSLLLYPFKKMIRTLVFVLAFKDCVDVASRWLHRGYLVAVSLERGTLDADALAREKGVWPVTLAIEETLMAQDTSPINQLVRQVFTHSPALLRATARDLARRLRPARAARTDTTEVVAEAAAAESEALSAVLAELSEAFWSQTRYLADLEARFNTHLEQTTARMLPEPPKESP